MSNHVFKKDLSKKNELFKKFLFSDLPYCQLRVGLRTFFCFWKWDPCWGFKSPSCI